MDAENSWNTFAHTGKVTDYLKYVKESRESYTNSVKEERKIGERTSDGDDTVRRYNW